MLNRLLFVAALTFTLQPIAWAAPHGRAGAVAQAKSIVARDLKDPSSVQFRDVRLSKASGSVCGEYNAKNGYGAYVGFALFGVTKAGGRIPVPPLDGLTGDYRQFAIDEFYKNCDTP